MLLQTLFPILRQLVSLRYSGPRAACFFSDGAVDSLSFISARRLGGRSLSLSESCGESQRSVPLLAVAASRRPLTSARSITPSDFIQDIVKVKKAAVLEAVKYEGKDEVQKSAVEGNNLIAKIGQSPALI